MEVCQQKFKIFFSFIENLTVGSRIESWVLISKCFIILVNEGNDISCWICDSYWINRNTIRKEILKESRDLNTWSVFWSDDPEDKTG